LVGNTN